MEPPILNFEIFKGKITLKPFKSRLYSFKKFEQQQEIAHFEEPTPVRKNPGSHSLATIKNNSPTTTSVATTPCRNPKQINNALIYLLKIESDNSLCKFRRAVPPQSSSPLGNQSSPVFLPSSPSERRWITRGGGSTLSGGCCWSSGRMR